MSNWNGLDFFIFLIFMVNTLLGMARGATREIISMMCLCLALVFTIKFTVPLSSFINSSPLIGDVITSPVVQNFMRAVGLTPLTHFTLAKIGYCLSLLICFVGVFSFCEAVLSYTGVLAVFSFPYAVMDRKIGAALGCTRGFGLVIVFILVYLLIFNSPQNSYFVNLFQDSALKFNELISYQAPERYKEVLNKKDLFDAKKAIDTLENPT